MARIEGRSHLKRESRPAFVAERLPVICQLGGDDHLDSSKALRVQILSGRHGISDSFAKLLAPLVWEGNRRD